MSAARSAFATLDQIADFDEVIDVRTPLEYAEDHIPGAINAPVLSNEERVIVGTLFKQASAFEGTRVGAALVARNIARHLETTFADRPRQWRPLIYCWRGGKRSGSMTTMFSMIGWSARQLEGGYKGYRRTTLAALAVLPAKLRYIVLTGPTGSGKTALLTALNAIGAQTLDLEALAAHRGSLLGANPGMAQPSQKAFDSALAVALKRFDAARPVFIEAESRRIGSITLPAVLVDTMHGAQCVELESTARDRAARLLKDYAHLFADRDFLKAQLERLVGLHSRERVRGWQRCVDNDARDDLAQALIDLHYDPAYARSSRQHFVQWSAAARFGFRPHDADGVAQARALLTQLGLPIPAPSPPFS